MKMLSLKLILTFIVFVAAEESAPLANNTSGANNFTENVTVPAATAAPSVAAENNSAVAVPNNSSNTSVSITQPNATEPSTTTVPPSFKSPSKATTLPLTPASPQANVPTVIIVDSSPKPVVTKPTTVKPRQEHTVPSPTASLTTGSPSEAKDMTSGGTYDGGTDVDERGKGTKINHLPREFSINATAASKLVQHTASFTPLSAVGMIAGLFVSVVVVGYLSLTLTRIVQRRRRGNLQLLVNEDDMDVTDEDLRHFEASCIHIDTET